MREPRLAKILSVPGRFTSLLGGGSWGATEPVGDNTDGPDPCE